MERNKHIKLPKAKHLTVSVSLRLTLREFERGLSSMECGGPSRENEMRLDEMFAEKIVCFKKVHLQLLNRRIRCSKHIKHSVVYGILAINSRKKSRVGNFSHCGISN